MTCETWLPLCRDLVLGDRLRLGLPGHEPIKDATDQASGKWLGASLERVAAYSGRRSVPFAGHSSEGLISLLLARRAPDFMRSVVSVGAQVTGHRDPEAIRRFGNRLLDQETTTGHIADVTQPASRRLDASKRPSRRLTR